MRQSKRESNGIADGRSRGKFSKEILKVKGNEEGEIGEVKRNE